MKTVTNKLSVASTSALVLSEVKSLYSDGWGREYLTHIDFSPVEKLANEMRAITPLFHEGLLIRKKMVRFLIKQLMIQHPRQQVCILAAGLDPLGLQIAEYFPDQLKSIYEVDNAHMQEKQEIYSAISFNDERLHTVQADISSKEQLMSALLKEGYNPEQPTLIVFEGIIHYISEEQFLSIMRNFCSRTKSNAVIMDYMIQNEDVSAAYLPKLEEMQQTMESYIGRRLQQYSRKKIQNLLSLLEGEVLDVYDMQAAEYVLSGQNKQYHTQGTGVLEMISFQI